MGLLKKKFMNRSWAAEQCQKKELPDSICDYVRSFQQVPDPATPLDEVTFVVFDCETTGLNPARDHILSIGAVKVTGREIRVADTFEELVHYSRDADRESIIVHGILPSQSLRGTDEKIVMERLLDYFGNAILVAHHAIFDTSIVSKSLKKHFGISLYNRYLDTILLSMRLENFNKSQDQLIRNRYSLDSLCLRYGIPQEERHTSIGDAFITGQLFIKLLRKARSRKIDTLGDLMH